MSALESQIAALQNDELRAVLATIMEKREPLRVPYPPVQASPLPWSLTDNDWEIYDADGQSIACFGHASSTPWGRLIDAVNGAMMVRAVNGWHDAAALRARLAELEARS